MSQRRSLLLIVLLAASLLGCLCTATPQGLTPTPAAGQLLSERSQVFFQKSAQQAEEVLVNDDRSAGAGDEIWTQKQGRALLRFPDLWVRIYDDTVLHAEEVTPSGIKIAMGSGAVLIGETPGALEDVTIVLGSPPRARVVLTGTLVMIAYIPSEQIVLVRAFDGKADVSVVETGQTAQADSDSAEWVTVGPENQLETPSRDDIRALARRVGFWDLYHEIELDAAGFGPPGAHLPPEKIDLTFIETPATPTPPTATRVHATATSSPRAGAAVVSPTPLPTRTRTPTPRPTRTRTPTPSPTRTRKPTPSPTRTWTPTRTPTRTWTPTRTPTRTWTPTRTPTRTWTPTRTRTPTRTPTPVNQKLPAPGIVKPKNNVTIGCPPSKIILDWTAPSDPSGIANYRVRLQVKTTVWKDKRIWDPIIATQVTATGEVTCGGVYRWRVVARDKAGNDGVVSDWAYFGVVIN
jgi:hypothetical protein